MVQKAIYQLFYERYMYAKSLSRLLKIRNSRGKKLRPILLNTMPKSASVFIWGVLARTLNISQVRIAHNRFPGDEIFLSLVRLFASKGNCVSQHHVPASEHNIALLNEYVDRVVIHVRDPRQATLSMYHFLHKLREDNEFWTYFSFRLNVSASFFSWSQKDKLDWMIDNYLPLLCEWVDGWLAASKKGSTEFKLLFTTFERFKRDPHAYFGQLLCFHDIESNGTLDVPEINGHGFHFRKGTIDEWRSVFSERQIVRADETIPSHLFEEFNWKRVS